MPLIFSTEVVTKNKKGTLLRTTVVIIGLEVLYAAHVEFTENNWYGKTFLMQNVNESDYLAFKQKY